MSEGAVPRVSTARLLAWGACGRCPRCGRGSVFRSFLDIARRCEACGLSLEGHDAGDGPAFAGVFILGFVVVALAFALERLFEPPLWVHALAWTPTVIGGAIGMLRPLKGMTVALQYRFRSLDEATEDQNR